MERFGCSLLVHSIIPSSIKGSVVNYDNGNIRTAEIKTFFFCSQQAKISFAKLLVSISGDSSI